MYLAVCNASHVSHDVFYIYGIFLWKINLNISIFKAGRTCRTKFLLIVTE